MIVYLAGHMDRSIPETITWRTKAAELLSSYTWDRNVLDPFRSQRTAAIGLTEKDIVGRDFNDVRKSDLLLMNLETYGSSRPMIGTIAELGWAYMMQKPVVAIASPNNWLRNHPFVRAIVSHFFENLEDAADFISAYYV